MQKETEEYFTTKDIVSILKEEGYYVVEGKEEVLKLIDKVANVKEIQRTNKT